MPTQQQKAESFKALHEGDPFVIPNPWDRGSARILEALGFKALATTSAGFAASLGRLDGAVTLEDIAGHVEELSAVSDLPVSVDLENGYGPAPEDAVAAVMKVAEAGAVGGSIEDWDPDDQRFYEVGEAAERIAAAHEAAEALDFKFMLVGRAENYFRDNPDLDDTIARVQAYEEAGADVVYAPRLRNTEELRAVCEAVSVPVNANVRPDLTVSDFFGAGVQRLSTGASLAFVAIKAWTDVAGAIAETGDLAGVRAPLPNLEDWLG